MNHNSISLIRKKQLYAEYNISIRNIEFIFRIYFRFCFFYLLSTFYSENKLRKLSCIISLNERRSSLINFLCSVQFDDRLHLLFTNMDDSHRQVINLAFRNNVISDSFAGHFPVSKIYLHKNVWSVKSLHEFLELNTLQLHLQFLNNFHCLSALPYRV